jgi:tetrahydromethanopterin S-methyltransferase subunit A
VNSWWQFLVSVDIDHAKCTGCGICVDACPSNVLSLDDTDAQKIALVTNIGECCACGACAIKCLYHAIALTGYELLKVEPPAEYPPEDGRYLRGNDLSPVAVVSILDTDDTNIPPELTQLVTTAVEAGAALAGTLQTENLGIEKIVANIVANPNIRFVVLCWREAHGHSPAEAIHCLVDNGVADDKRRTIIGATAPTPYVANLSNAAIERFRRQVTIVNIIREEDPSFGMRPENLRRAVHACIQEKPTKFEEHLLYDPGAWPEPPICEKLSKRLTEPWRPEMSSKEVETLQRMKLAANGQTSKSSKASPVKKRDEQDDQIMLELLGIQKKHEDNEEQND